MEINAKKLMVPERLDLVAKYLFAKEVLENGVIHPMTLQLYLNHIEAFSGGTFKEPNQPKKNSPESYVNTFIDVILSLKEKGFDNKTAIPISQTGVILDGAHRTAASAVLNLNVCVQTVENNAIYDYIFFRNHLLDDRDIEYLVCRYLDITDSTFGIIFSNNQEKTDLILKKKKISCIYKKRVNINPNMADNIVSEIQSLKSEALPESVVNAITDMSNTRVVINVISLTDEILNMVSSDGTVLYFSYDKEEVRRLANIFFNTNSLTLISTLPKKEYIKLFDDNLQIQHLSNVDYTNIVCINGINCDYRAIARNTLSIYRCCLLYVFSVFSKIRYSILFFRRKLRNVRSYIRDYLADKKIFFVIKTWHYIKGKGYKL